MDAHYPYVLKVGPSSTGRDFDIGKNGGIENLVPNTCDCAALIDSTKMALDHFSYHCYNGISERLEPAMPYAHWKAEEAHTEEFLAVQPLGAKTYAPLRDKYVPGGQMWVSESGDAGGGDTWASTYLDVLRTLNELGGFSEVTDGIIFHNTLCSSDYGFLKHGTFDPRPNYFAVLLWNRLMGPIVYEAGEEIREGAHVYVRSRKDGKAGFACVVINNSLTDETTVLLPKAAEVYAGIRSRRHRHNHTGRMHLLCPLNASDIYACGNQLSVAPVFRRRYNDPQEKEEENCHDVSVYDACGRNRDCPLSHY